MKFASRIGRVPPYPFVEISRKIAARKADGIDVISFGIGDPDIPTPDFVVDALREAALDPPNHRYPESDGLPEFKSAVADWYSRRFGVALDADAEVLSLIGAKEGIGHASFCFIEPGDIALVPDPGYPVYAVGAMFAGGESYFMPLERENGFLPDLDAIPQDVADRATVMWLNYPNNPTGAVAEEDYFPQGDRLRAAKRHRAPARRVLQRGRLRRLQADQLPRGRGREGGRARVPLALQVLQHDRLAAGDGRRQRRDDR